MRSKRIRFLLALLALLALGIAWWMRTPRPSPRATATEPAEIETASVPSTPLVRDETASSTPSPNSTTRGATERVPEPAREAPPPPSVVGASSVTGRALDAAGNPMTGVRVLAKFAVDANDADDHGLPLWQSRLPLDVADPTALGVEAARETITDADGRFGFSACPPGRFRLALRSDRWAPRDFDDRILPGESHLALADIELEPGVILIGIVLDSRGRPLEGARIASLDDFFDPTLPDLSARVAPLLAVTDRRGEFRTRALATGPASTIVCAPDAVDPIHAEAPEIRFETSCAEPREISGIQIEIPASARIIGHVLARAVDRSSIRVAAIRASASRSVVPATCRADYRAVGLRSNGTFELDGLIEGDVYELRAISPTQFFDEDCPWSPPELAVAGLEGDVTLVSKADSSLSFEVEDSRTHARVAQYTVALRGATPRASRGNDGTILDRHADGRTRIEGVRPLRRDARFTLELAGDRFRDVLRDEQLSPGGDLDLSPIDVELLPLADVLVRAKETGAAIAGARLHAIEQDPVEQRVDFAADAITDARGTARIASPPSNSSSIVATATGFAPAKKRGFEIRAGGSTSTFDLVAGAKIRVRVIDASGVPIAGIQVEHAPNEWTPNDFTFDDGELDPMNRSRVTSSAGTCTFADLGLGRHTFRVARRAPHLDGEWKIVSLAQDGPKDVDLVTRAFGSVVGRVRDGTKPLPGVRISACAAQFFAPHALFVEAGRPLPAGIGTRSDSRGGFGLQNLEPGLYVLVFEIEGQSLRIAREVQVDSGEHVVNVDVGADLIEGKITNADGSPAVNAMLWVVSRDDEWLFDTRYFASDRVREGVNLEPWTACFPSDFAHPSVVADQMGHFSLRGLAHNTAFSLFASDGAQSGGWVQLGATRRARDERALAIALEPRGSVRVTADPARWHQPLVLVARSPLAAPRVQRLRPGLELTLPALEPGTWSLTLFEERKDQRYFPVLDPVEVAVAPSSSETVDITWP